MTGRSEVKQQSKKRSDKRLSALASILVDGLYYEWFRCTELNEDSCTATILADTGEYTDDGGSIYDTHEIGPDDIARGLRMYREAMEGKREWFAGEWKYRIKDLLREGKIADESEFKPEIHCRAKGDAYGWQTVLFDRTNGRDGDYDANTADAVLQFAIFGETVYG